MKIPGDPEQRFWVEVSGANPDLTVSYRPSLVCFIAFEPNGEAKIAGSGFIIGAGSGFAAVITAKHVLFEGVSRIQRPHSMSAPSAIFVPESIKQPNIEPASLKALWMGSSHAAMLDVVSVEYNESTDSCCCLVAASDSDQRTFKPTAIPLDTSIPSRGDVVHMVSQASFSVATEGVKHERVLQVRKAVSMRVGVVTNVHPKGLRQYKWPCFTTSIPAEPGMSGGLVTLPKEGKNIGACGIVCADSSDQKARVDQKVQGESIIAVSWTSLGLRVPESWPILKSTSRVTLLEMIRRGDMPSTGNGIERIEISSNDYGGYRITRR